MDEEKNNPVILVEEEKESLLDSIGDVAESAIFTILAFFLLFTYVFRFALVDGDSMLQTLKSGDRLIVWAMSYEPENGDIVVINSDYAYLLDSEGEVYESNGLGKYIVKRIIATGGQTVDIDFNQGDVYVDGSRLSETYIINATTLNEGAFEYPVTIPEGYFFVLGDNRGNSKDSRSYEIGLIPESKIVGKVILRTYPLENLGIVK